MAGTGGRNTISQEVYDAWLVPSAAVALIAKFTHANFARHEIWRRLKSGVLRSAAGTMVSSQDRLLLGFIAPSAWAGQNEPPDYATLWQSGGHDFTVSGHGGYGDYDEVSCFDIRFEASGVEAIVKSCGGDDASQPVMKPPVTTDRPVAELPSAGENKGGRPPKDYWEDLIISMMVKWALGDLKPRRKADVQKAMEDWLTERGEKWSETPVKQRAAKVFQAIQKTE